MMNRDGLQALYDYNTYANRLVLDTVECLTEEEFVRQSSPSNGSVRGLLLHMLAVETYFLTCSQGRPARPVPIESNALADIRRKWSELEREQQDFISGLREADPGREIRVPMRDSMLTLPIWQALMQAFTQSIHHRGELSIVLTGLGHPLPTLDVIIYHVRRSGQEWPWE